jgi:hypothetical protein
MILKNTDASQTFSVIPRTYGNQFTMEIRDDSTNVATLYEIDDATTVGNYLTFTKTLNPVLIENHYYDLRLFVDDNVWNTNYNIWNDYDFLWNVGAILKTNLYKDRIFCTNQTIDQNNDQYYQVNKDQYVEDDSFNNEYIVV